MNTFSVFFSLAIGGVMLFGACSSTPESKEQSEEETVFLQETTLYRDSLDILFRRGKESPFYKYKNFTKLNFYEPDIRFRLRVKAEAQTEPEIVQFQTTTDRKPVYLKKYLFRFTISGQGDSLWGYVKNETPNRVFVPFKDLTNSNTTYAGGRYIDLDIKQDSDSVWLDFNRAYNPYCHYDTSYSCPLVPFENRLPFAVEAGEKRYK